MPGRDRGGVVRRVGERDVIEGIDEVDDVLVARREVPAHAALLDQDAQRVRPARGERRVAVPGEPPDVALRGSGPGPGAAGSKRSWLASPDGTLAAVQTSLQVPVVSPRKRVFRVGRVVDRLDLLAVLGGALRIEEEGAGGVARPSGLASAPMMPAICRPELNTYWSAVPLGQNPPPIVDELVESTQIWPVVARPQ